MGRRPVDARARRAGHPRRRRARRRGRAGRAASPSRPRVACRATSAAVSSRRSRAASSTRAKSSRRSSRASRASRRRSRASRSIARSSTFRLGAEEAVRIGGEVDPARRHRADRRVRGHWQRVPRGPVLAITPFNFPLNLVAHKVAPALACGAPVVLKPAPQTPLTALKLAEIVRDAGAPDDMLQVVPCTNEVAERLVRSDAFGVLVLHRQRQGRLVPQVHRRPQARDARAGRQRCVHRTRRCMQYPRSPTLAQPRADRGGACARARSTTRARSASRRSALYVHRPIVERFLAELVPRACSYTPQDPRSATAAIGPMIDERSAMRVETWIDEARAAGAHMLAYGKREGNRLPAVVVRIDGDGRGLKLVEEEAFGPVLTVHVYETFPDALRMVERHALRPPGRALHRLAHARERGLRRARRRRARRQRRAERARRLDAVRRPPRLRHRPRGREVRDRRDDRSQDADHALLSAASRRKTRRLLRVSRHLVGTSAMTYRAASLCVLLELLRRRPRRLRRRRSRLRATRLLRQRDRLRRRSDEGRGRQDHLLLRLRDARRARPRLARARHHHAGLSAGPSASTIASVSRMVAAASRSLPKAASSGRRRRRHRRESRQRPHAPRCRVDQRRRHAHVLVARLRDARHRPGAGHDALARPRAAHRPPTRGRRAGRRRSGSHRVVDAGDPPTDRERRRLAHCRSRSPRPTRAASSCAASSGARGHRPLPAASCRASADLVGNSGRHRPIPIKGKLHIATHRQLTIFARAAGRCTSSPPPSSASSRSLTLPNLT